MRQFKIQAIVIKRRNLGEADRILTVFSPTLGKLTLLAKGIRRIHSRRAPHLELFNRVELSVHRGRTWDIIVEASCLETFSKMKSDLPSIALAFTLSELVDVLCAERQENKGVYQLLLSALHNLDSRQSRSSHPNFTQEMGQALLQELGFINSHKLNLSFDSLKYIEELIERKLLSREFQANLTRGHLREQEREVL